MSEVGICENKIEHGPDLYKKKERNIRQFMRNAMEDPQTKKQRLWKESLEQKSKDPPFDWSEVVDSRKIGTNDEGSRLKWKSSLPKCLSPHTHECCGSLPQLYELQGNPPGLFVISNALCAVAQLYWAKKALVEYSKVEHNNLSNLAKLYAEDHDEPEPSINANDNSNSTQSNTTESAEDYSHVTNNLWEEAIAENNDFASFKKLRWSCLGYHYDWTKRCYEKNVKSSFPEDLAQLCRNLAQLATADLIPEAAIINFYPMSSTMGGHLDDAEHDLAKPIISLSLGCSALYLLGGRKKDLDPLPLLLRSGDAIIMTGESRLCYHGIPAILPHAFEAEMRGLSRDSLASQLADHLAVIEEEENNISQHVLRYLEQHRINMNARQVCYEGKEELWCDKTGTGHVKYEA